MAINIAQVRLTALANNNGTLADPLTQAFRPDPYVPQPAQRAISDSAQSQSTDLIVGTPAFSTPPGMLYLTQLTVSQPTRILSLSVKNLDPALTIWLRFQTDAATYPSYPQALVALPILGGGILSLPTPIAAAALSFYSPQVGMGVDYMTIGAFPN